MISLNLVLDEGEWSSSVEISNDHQISKDEAISILYASRISKDCFINTANLISKYFDADTMRGMISSAVYGFGYDEEGKSQHTIVPTLTTIYDNSRRNDEVN
jgi:hypothetical protein